MRHTLVIRDAIVRLCAHRRLLLLAPVVLMTMFGLLVGTDSTTGWASTPARQAADVRVTASLASAPFIGIWTNGVTPQDSSSLTSAGVGVARASVYWDQVETLDNQF